MLLRNLSRLLDDPRRRNVILVTLLLLLTMLFIGSIRLLNQVRGKRLQGVVSIEPIPAMRSIPGGMETPPSQAYTKLQMEHNQQMAEKAKKTGRSAIGTIVNSFGVEDNKLLPPERKALSRGYASASMLSKKDQMAASRQAFLSQQQTELTKQQLQGAMQQQMNQLFNAWSRAPMQESGVAIESSRAVSESAGAQGVYGKAPLIKAGTILHAILLTEINSDEPSPVLAKIMTGDLEGGRLIGSLSRVGERLLVQFHTLNLPKASQALPVNALAVDETTAKTSLASHVDRHLLLRYGSLIASLFLQGYGVMFQNQGGQLIYNDINANNTNNAVNRRVNWPWLWTLFNPLGPALSAAGNVGMHFGAELAQQVRQPPTVCVHAGTAIGILFTADLSDFSLSKP
jgi:intracellular multiplication protein IcmE